MDASLAVAPFCPNLVDNWMLKESTITATPTERSAGVRKAAAAVRKRASHLLRIQIPSHTLALGSPPEMFLCLV
jgi:hypothetical protein